MLAARLNIEPIPFGLYSYNNIIKFAVLYISLHAYRAHPGLKVKVPAQQQVHVDNNTESDEIHTI